MYLRNQQRSGQIISPHLKRYKKTLWAKNIFSRIYISTFQQSQVLTMINLSTNSRYTKLFAKSKFRTNKSTPPQSRLKHHKLPRKKWLRLYFTTKVQHYVSPNIGFNYNYYTLRMEINYTRHLPTFASHSRRVSTLECHTSMTPNVYIAVAMNEWKTEPQTSLQKKTFAFNKSKSH